MDAHHAQQGPPRSMLARKSTNVGASAQSRPVVPSKAAAANPSRPVVHPGPLHDPRHVGLPRGGARQPGVSKTALLQPHARRNLPPPLPRFAQRGPQPLRKHVLPPDPIHGNPPPPYLASRNRAQYPTKSQPLQSRWIFHDPNGHNDDDGSITTGPRMTAVHASRRRHVTTANGRFERQMDPASLRPRGGVYLSRGFRLREIGDSDNDDDDAAIRSMDTHPGKTASSSVPRRLNSQLATKSTPRVLVTKTPRRPAIHYISSDSSDDSDIDTGKDSGLEDLVSAFGRLSLPANRLKEYRSLPFLVRNLRRGFAHRCRLVGIATEIPDPPKTAISVLYRYQRDDDSDAETVMSNESEDVIEKEGSMLNWTCPLCQLHGIFKTRQMLDFHLREDHAEVKVVWSSFDKSNEESWKLSLTIATQPETDIESSTDEEEEEVDELVSILNAETYTTRVDAHVKAEKLSSPLILASAPEDVTSSPAVQLEEMHASQITAPIPIVADAPDRMAAAIPNKFRAYSPTPGSSTTNTFTASRTLSTARSSSATARASTEIRSIRGALPARYPTPPPSEDPLGPAARPPYFPEESSAEGESYRSFRPGGERIYDLLNTLPLEPFGVLAWAIVDREEELFEVDDLRDEDKVMLALWNRWIMLNRKTFIFGGDYCKPLKIFINDYWRMIHRAAGWGALRVFLLIFVAHRFIDGLGLVSILKHYESYTGMDYWYKDNFEENV